MAARGAWLLVDAESRRDLWIACWTVLREDADVADVLAAIAHVGTATVPDFALVRCEGNETRVVVRGCPSVELHYGADATTLVRATRDGNWTDRLFAGTPIALRLTNESEPGYTPDGAAMPLERGVVQASIVGFGLDSFARRQSAPVAEPAVFRPLSEFVTGQPSAQGVDAGVPDFNLDGFLLRQSAETANSAGFSSAAPAHASASSSAGHLPLDDMSWLGNQTEFEQYNLAATTQATASAATPPMHAATAAAPAPEPAPPPYVVPASASAPEPAAGGLSFDAEATTFRPGRAPVQMGAAGQSVVLAVICPSGHANAPRTPECRICRLPVPADQQPRAVARPALGRLRLSTGEVHVLDRGFLLGRSPVPRATATGPEPNVLRLISRDGDVSRTHAEIRLEGWQVIVADLGSMNGTYVTGPGLPPRVLSGGDEQVIEPGCVVTLASDVWIAYEVAE